MGIFYVSFDPTAESNEEGSFWSSLAFWEDDEEEIGPGIFQFKVLDEGDQCRVIVLKEDGTTVSTELAKRMLSLLDKQIY